MNGAELKQWRERLGLTQKALAAQLHVHELTIARYEQHPDKPLSRLLELLLVQLLPYH